MALFDEDVPRKRPIYELGEDLSTLSIGELDERVQMLKDEIARIEQVLSEKKSSVDIAASFFKS